MKIGWHVFFTIGTSYEQEAKRLSDELQQRDIDCYTIGFEKGKSWMSNCMVRAKKLASMGYKTPVGLLDCDLRLIGQCDLLKEWDNESDIYVHHRPERVQYDQYCAGIVAFNTAKGQMALRKWAKLCEQDALPQEPFREQYYLKLAIEDYKIKLRNVGINYNYVNNDVLTFEQMKTNGIEILHGDLNGPASRRYLKEVGGSRL